MSRREISASDNISRMLRGVAVIGAIGWLILTLGLQVLHVGWFEVNFGADLMGMLSLIWLWVTIISIALIAVSAAVKKGLVIFILACALAAGIILMLFFPASIEWLFT